MHQLVTFYLKKKTLLKCLFTITLPEIPIVLLYVIGHISFSDLSLFPPPPKKKRNKDFQEVTLEKDGQVLLRFAAVYGFRNIQNLVQKLKRGKSPYHFVEVMACPSGQKLHP